MLLITTMYSENPNIEYTEIKKKGLYNENLFPCKLMFYMKQSKYQVIINKCAREQNLLPDLKLGKLLCYDY